MRTVIANIGLVTGAEYGEVKEIPLNRALECLKYRIASHEGILLNYKIEKSNTEDTLIISLEIDSHYLIEKYPNALTGGYNVNLNNFFYELAQSFRQEAIAYYVVEEQQGYLVGEYKEKWGNEFNPEYFLI